MDRVRLAVVGCGNICQLNVPGYLEHPRCDVVALCDTDKARAELRARQWGITPTIYTDYAELLGDPEVDAVELLTPTYLHADQIVAALAAGKHVSCQKPIAVSVAEVDRIAAAVATARTVFRVTENFLYYPPIVKAKALLDAGAIGEPSLVRIHTTRAREIVGSTLPLDPEALVWRRDPRRNPGGALYDDGVHKYATAMYWIGDIGEISALVGRSADFLQETPSVAHFRIQGEGLPRHHRLHLRPRHADPQPLLSRRRVLRDSRLARHHLGHPLHRRDARLAAGHAHQGHRNHQLPGAHGLAHRLRRRRARFRRWIAGGPEPAQDVGTAKKVLQVPWRSTRRREHAGPWPRNR